MIIHSILKSLLTGVFAIDARHLQAYFPVILSMLIEGKINIGEYSDTQRTQAEELNSSVHLVLDDNENFVRVGPDEEVETPSIYVMQLRGVVSKYDDWWYGIRGTSSLKDDLIEKMRDPMVSAVMFIVDSPGGMVDGTFEFADAIRDMRAETGKPVVGFIDGMACSGGYAPLSQCDYIFASHATATAGSVGVYTSWMSLRKMLEKHGIQIHTIIAPNSPEKIKAFLDAEEGNYEMMEKKLAVLQDIFKETVTTGRPNINERALRGDSFFGKKSIELGLIDAIGTIEDAINYTYSLTQNS